MKKRILSFLLALVMVAVLLPATALTAFAAQYTAVGVSVQSDGVVCDDGWYFLDYPSIYLLYSDNSSTFASSVSPLYTDEECLDYLTSAPVLGEKYYFQVFAYAYSDTDYSVTNSKSSIDVEGFCSGRVEDAYKDGAVYTVTCSIIYGELTGGVKAVASGVEYDSAKGGYAPNFTTLKAVSTEGKELEHTMVDGKYSYYWAKSGCLYKTNSGTSFSNMLTTEPQEGETYYSYFLLNSIDGNLNIEEELVDIRIPGYEVEYLASYGRDMGFTSLVVYSVTKSAPKVYVGGVGMYDGDYLAVGATATRTTKPSGGYAYYKDGTLTLNNYSYEGKGYLNSSGYYAVIYSKNDLTLELIGNNTLTQKDYFNTACIWGEANVSLTGAGILNLKNAAWGIISAYDLSIESGNLNVDACELGIYSWNQEVIINGGSLKIDATKCAVNSYRGIEINGGSGIFRNTQDSVYNVLHAQYGSGPVTIDPSLVVMASTTADGELGEYVAANLANYKKIVIKTPGVYVGGVVMYDGDYLAVGATATQTTKPSGGYAYYKDGKLTLNNYSYEGKGYLNSSGFYAVIYTKNDLTLELIGNNTLIQTESDSDMIYVDGANLTVGGDGKLTGTAGGYALYADKDITINGGTVEVSTYYACILSYGGEVIINDGDITAESESRAGIYSYYGVTVNGGNVTAIGGGSKAISYDYSGSFTVAEGMKIQASTTVDGTLGEYVAANHDSYKKIVIKPDASNVLKGDVNGDGYVDNLDAAMILKYDAGILDSINEATADVNGDGYADNLDAAKILKYDAGIIDEL